MGNGALTRRVSDGDAIIGLLMPSYYVAQPIITASDIDHVQRSWCIILGQEGMQYKNMKEVRRLNEDHSCLTWFYNTFFHRVRLLSIHCPTETTQNAFSNSKFLLNIIRCVLCVHEQDTKFHMSTQSLFSTIDKYSITFCDMCMIGGVLFTALQECLGMEFSSEVKYSWIKLYSVLLRDLAHEFARRGAARDADSSSTMSVDSASSK